MYTDKHVHVCAAMFREWMVDRDEESYFYIFGVAIVGGDYM